MTLHSCFQPAFLTPDPAPLQSLALANNTGSRRVTHRPGDSVAELSGAEGTEAVRGDLTTKLHLHWWLIHSYSNRTQPLARRSQPGQPSPPAWRNAPCGRWCSSTLDSSGTGRMGSSVGQAPLGRLTNVVVPLSSWFCPAHFGLMPQERSGTTSAAARVPCFRKKEGDMMLGMVVR